MFIIKESLKFIKYLDEKGKFDSTMCFNYFKIIPQSFSMQKHVKEHTLKKKKILSRECQSEVSLKNKYCMLTHTGGIQKNCIDDLICNRNRETDIGNKCMDSKGESWQELGGWN